MAICPLMKPLKFQWFATGVSPAVTVRLTARAVWSTANQSGVVMAPVGRANVGCAGAAGGAEPPPASVSVAGSGSPPPQATAAARTNGKSDLVFMVIVIGVGVLG